MLKKSLFLCFVIIGSLIYAQNDQSVKSISHNGKNYNFYGQKFDPENVITAEEMLVVYSQLELDETKEVVFTGKVNSVCQSKGCWMRLDLGIDNQESFVKFKDYAFFIPMDSENSTAIIKGTAAKKETSVAELKHFAEDAGKSEEEIQKITEPKVEYTFMAEGVMLSQAD